MLKVTDVINVKQVISIWIQIHQMDVYHVSARVYQVIVVQQAGDDKLFVFSKHINLFEKMIFLLLYLLEIRLLFH